MKAVNHFKRELGFKFYFPNTAVQGLLARKTQILQGLQKNGCICIKNVNFDQSQLIKFTEGIWDKVIQLPKFLCFNNQHELYKKVARVGNVLLDGTLKDSQKQAAYWHQDGNFWGEQKKHIFNCLHTREIPDVGGDTHVMDLVEGAAFLKKNRFNLYSRLKQLIGVLRIEDINDFVLYKAQNTLNIQSVTHHELITQNPKLDQQRLFLSVHKFLQRTTKQQSKDLSIAQVLRLMQTEMGFYAHKWQKGDLLIWDNLQVMHRSSGSFSGRRLLFRTQGRFQQNLV